MSKTNNKIKCSKRNMTIKIGLVESNINIYNNIELDKGSDRNEFNDVFINEESSGQKLSFMILDTLEFCVCNDIKSFIEINDIKLENNILGYEFYSEKDIKRILNAMNDYSDLILIRLGFLNEQTNEIPEYPNLEMIYKNIVPTYEQYGFKDISFIIGGYEGSVVMGFGSDADKLIEKYKEENKHIIERVEKLRRVKENNNLKTYAFRLFTFDYIFDKTCTIDEIPYIGILKASSDEDAMTKICEKEFCEKFEKDKSYKSYSNFYKKPEERYNLFKPNEECPKLVVYLYEIDDEKAKNVTHIQDYIDLTEIG